MPLLSKELLDYLLGLAALVGVVCVWLRWLRPRWRRLSADITAIRDTLLGRPEVRDSITGEVIARELPGIGKRVANIEHEFKPNSGSSARDAWDRIEKRLGRGAARLARIEEHVGLDPFEDPDAA